MKFVPKELLDKYRDVNVDHDWWEFLWEEEKEDLAKIGFDARDFGFSGFCSQGDGASFTGHVVDFVKFWEAFDPDPDNYHMLRKAEYVDVYLVRLGSHYVHEHTVFASIDASEWRLDSGDDDPFKAALYKIWNEQLDRDINQFRYNFETFMRDRMCALYRKLEEEYEYLTSDEQVTEWVRECVPDELEEFEECEA